LLIYINEQGLEDDGHLHSSKAPAWKIVAERMNNGRTSKQCRERWASYLRPGIKKGKWTYAEEQLIMEMYSTLGPK
jgi:transcription factor MYB, plant